jgi:small-conductance mechanosensitive channel
LLTYAVIKSKLELKLFILFAVLIVIASLVSAFPNDDRIVPWETMYRPNIKQILVIPTLCFVVTLLYLAFNAETKIIKTAALILLLLTPIGIAIDWQYPSFREPDFQKQLARI